MALRIMSHKKASVLLTLFIFVEMFTALFIVPDMAHALLITKPSINSLNIGLWYSFDGNDSISGFTDGSGNGRTGYLAGNTSTTTAIGKIGQALLFDGAATRVNGGSSFLLNSAATVVMWMKPRSLGEGNAGMLASDGAMAFSLTSSNRLQFSSDNQTTNALSASSAFSFNEWTHVAVSRTAAGVANIYVNGVLSGTADQASGATSGATANIIIGNNAASSATFDGALDSVRVYTRVLSASEIAMLYRAGKSTVSSTANTGPQSGAIAWYTFDGPQINWAANTMADKSNQSRTGTITNMSTTSSPKQGKIGQAFMFDGDNDMITTGSDFIGTTDLTISAWIYPKSTGEGGAGKIVSNGNTLFETTATNRVRFSSDGATFASAANSSLTMNAWNFVTITRTSAGTANLYVNAALSGSANQSSGTPAGGSTNVTIGNVAAGTATFDGLIDDVRVFNRVLSTAEISQLYKDVINTKMAMSPVGQVTNGLYAYLTFDGNDINWGTNRLTDRGPNSFTASTTGMSTTTSPAPGKMGQGLRFDGANDGVDIGSSMSAISGTDTKSISLWAFPTVATDSILAVICRTNGTRAFAVSLTTTAGGRWSGVYRSTGDANATVGGIPANATLNTWTHLVMVQDGVNINFYINGTSVASASNAAIPTLTNPSNTTIGAALCGTASRFIGIIDDVRFYSRGLTAAEVGALYRAGLR